MRYRGREPAAPCFAMNWEGAKKKEKYILIPIYFVLYLISHFTGIRCIWKTLFKIVCPGCGYTRAVLNMYRLDLSEAWKYHPMFWSSFIIVAYFVFEGEVFKNKIVNRVIGWLIIIGFLVVWVSRLINGIVV